MLKGMFSMIIWLHDSKAKDLKLTGGKGASLSQMSSANLPIPEGFVVSTNAYLETLSATGVDKLIEKELSNLDVNDEQSVGSVSSFIQNAIENIKMPASLENSLIQSYKKLCPMDEPVAVRSSATAEDLPEASFAGQQETYLGVVEAEQVIKRVKSCWASCFTDRAIVYRAKHQIKDEQVAAAVVVQKLVEADKAGVMFTVNPITNKEEVVVEACWGLGEALVSGEVSPDQYIVDKSTNKVILANVLPKTHMIVRHKSEVTTKEVPHDKVRERVLSDNELKRLNELAIKLEEFFGAAQDVEWAIKLGKVYLLQSRPVTTVSTV